MSGAKPVVSARLVNAWAFARYERERRVAGFVHGFAYSWNGESVGFCRRYRAEALAQIERTFGDLLRWL